MESDTFDAGLETGLRIGHDVLLRCVENDDQLEKAGVMAVNISKAWHSKN